MYVIIFAMWNHGAIICDKCLMLRSWKSMMLLLFQTGAILTVYIERIICWRWVRQILFSNSSRCIHSWMIAIIYPLETFFVFVLIVKFVAWFWKYFMEIYGWLMVFWIYSEIICACSQNLNWSQHYTQWKMLQPKGFIENTWRVISTDFRIFLKFGLHLTLENCILIEKLELN